MFSLAELEAARADRPRGDAADAAVRWPLLNAAPASTSWVKHENHTPTGAFKVRGGLVYADRSSASGPHLPGVITATRGNHGQSLAFACGARRHRLHGRRAARQFDREERRHAGVRRRADRARPRLRRGARARGRDRGGARLRIRQSFDRDLVLGVATYAHELFTAAPELDAVYVPIGLGSGICGVIAARDALGLQGEGRSASSRIAPTPTGFRSMPGRCVPTNSALTFADGMAVRMPDAEALAIMRPAWSARSR